MLMSSPYRQIGYGLLLTGGLVAAVGSTGCASLGRQQAQVQPAVYDAKADAQRTLQQLVSEMQSFVFDVVKSSPRGGFNIFDSVNNTNFEASGYVLLNFIGEVDGKKVTYYSRSLVFGDEGGLDKVIIEEGENLIEITREHILNRFGNRIEDTNKGVWDTHESTYHRLLTLAYGEAKKISAQESQEAKPLVDKVNR